LHLLKYFEDEQAILSCMIYVDLNPIRADISKSLESSDYTSIQQRIDAIKSNETPQDTIKLSSFIGSSLKKNGISFDLKDYLELADWTGRVKRDDKRGSIATTTPSILKQLQLDDELWMETGVDQFVTTSLFSFKSNNIFRE
jgi:hypothetical protein